LQELEAAVRTAEKRHAAAQESMKERGKTGYLRLAAEVDNYRKRRNLDRDGLQREAVVRALKSFVPVMEGFETAEAVLTLETESEQKFSSNYQSLYRQVSGQHLMLMTSSAIGSCTCGHVCCIGSMRCKAWWGEAL
jgi:molecular chaperone GrpE (heat shock protein)